MSIFLFKNNKEQLFHNISGYQLNNDIDPSLNMTAGRLIYQYFKGIQIQTLEEYDLIQNIDYTNFNIILQAVNQSPIIKRDQQLGKIYFVQENFKKLFDEETLYKQNIVAKLFSFEEILQNNQVDQRVKDFIIQNSIIEFVQNYFKKPTTKFAILNSIEQECYINYFETLCQGIFQGENEEWHSYKLFKDEYPADINQYKGVIISGSTTDAYSNNINWIVKSREYIRKVIQESENCPKILGICWGHQLIAHSTGGKCEKMNIPFIRGKIQAKFTKEALDLDCFKRSKLFQEHQNDEFYLAESHGDHVVTLPQDAILLSKSALTENNMFIMKNNRVMGVQFHPEYNFTIAYYAIKKFVLDQQKQQQVIKDTKETYNKQPNSHEIIREVLEIFLKM